MLGLGLCLCFLWGYYRLGANAAPSLFEGGIVKDVSQVFDLRLAHLFLGAWGHGLFFFVVMGKALEKAP
jgi:hypothetical protein